MFDVVRNFDHILSSKERKCTSGVPMEPVITEMLGLHMLSGTRDGLHDMHSILISKETANSLFGKIR